MKKQGLPFLVLAAASPFLAASPEAEARLAGKT